MKVFLSLPMRGRTDSQIKGTIDAYTNLMKEIFGFLEDKIEVVHNYCPEAEEPFEKDVIYPTAAFLGMAAKKMSECNYIAFTTDYRNARGCCIEELIAERANMPRIYFEERLGEPHIRYIMYEGK